MQYSLWPKYELYPIAVPAGSTCRPKALALNSFLDAPTKFVGNGGHSIALNAKLSKDFLLNVPPPPYPVPVLLIAYCGCCW